MTIKMPIDHLAESFSLRDISREVLGESDMSQMDIHSRISTLKNELMYYLHQAEHGQQKSQHVFADKANKIQNEIEKLENIYHQNGDVYKPVDESEQKVKHHKVNWLVYLPGPFGGRMFDDSVMVSSTLSAEDVKKLLIKRGKPAYIQVVQE